MIARLMSFLLAASLAALAGCGERPDANESKPGPAAARVDNDGKVIAVQPTSLAKTPSHLPFKDAVILSTNPPEGELMPPNATKTKKNAVKIFEVIADRLWDEVNFKDKEGRRVRYQATITTDLGDIQIDLHGHLAPNHVRSFVCLAKSGYYDGMEFYYSIQRMVEDNLVAYIESGCPRGTGEAGSGSIGYWLRPEISDQLTHQD